MAFRSSVKFLFAGAAALLLAACGTMDIDRVRTAQPTGASPFNVALTNEYRELAVYEADKMYDWPDAVRWSQKGLAASNNQLVLPEQLGDWRLPADKLGELTNARLRLVTALDGSARSKLPADAARAQAMFDCWVEQQEENWQHDHIAACRQGFLDAMQKVDEAMAPPKPAAPAPVGTPAPAGPFTVYFAFDSANLSAEALRIVRSAADAARDTRNAVRLLGSGQAHTHEHILAAPSLTDFGCATSSALAFAQAGVTTADIDLAEIYDSFTITLLIELESIGFFTRGEAGKAALSGAISPGGRLPVNTHGGLMSYGHSGAAGGAFHIVEAVHQLRNEAADRQVPDAGIAFVHGDGGILSAHCSLVLGKD